MTRLEQSLLNQLQHWQGEHWKEFIDAVHLKIMQVERVDIWAMLQQKPQAWKPYKALIGQPQKMMPFWVLKQAKIRAIVITTEEYAKKIEQKCCVCTKGYMLTSTKDIAAIFTLDDLLEADPNHFCQVLNIGTEGWAAWGNQIEGSIDLEQYK